MSEEVALLLRRAGFGPTAAALAAARKAGYAATVAALTAPSGPDAGAAATPVPKLGLDPYADKPNPTNEQRQAADGQRRDQTEVITRWWLNRMVAADRQAVEKLLFFWHGHWATSIEKVMSPQLMLRQHLTFRGSADFVTLARAMVRDGALVYSLDGHTNTKQSPNENLGRELMELFMLGIGNYTEQDVKAAGRALTGWWVNLGGETASFNAEDFDDSVKTVLGVTANFTAQSLVDHLLAQPACPRFVAARLWFRYGSSSDPLPKSTEQKMVAAFPQTMAMLRALFEDEAFVESAGKQAKQPVEWLVGALRQLNLRPSELPEGSVTALLAGLRELGQVLFLPPSVGGWPSGAAWLTPSSTRVRLGLAWKLAELANIGPLSPDDLAALLAVDTWSSRTYAVLRDTTDPKLVLAIGLSSPEYLVT